MTILEFEALEFEGKMMYLESLERGAKRRYDILMHRYKDNPHHMTCIKAEYKGLRDQKTRMIKKGCILHEVNSFINRYMLFQTDTKKPA